MIYTITLNPSIDYYVTLDQLKIGQTNVALEQRRSLGGKGLNVSRVLSTFNLKNKAYTILAGETGQICYELLKKAPYEFEALWASSGETRINIKIKDKSETEINGLGPEISSTEIGQLMVRLGNLKKGDVLILAGSAPKNVGDDIYKRLLRYVDKEVLVVVDATNRYLLSALNFRPFLIKPNLKELEEIYGRKIRTDEEIMKAMKYLKSLGARNVMVSLGAKGAVLLNDYSRFYFAKAKDEEVINSVGSGDCMIAAFIAAYLKIDDYKKALLMATAAGSANAYSEDLPTYKKIKDVLIKTEIHEVY